MKKRNWNLNELVYKNFKLSLGYIKRIKNYIWFSLFLFFGLMVIGIIFPGFFEKQILEMIAELIKETEDLDGLSLVRFIFINNIKSGFFAMILGVFLGITPFIIGIVNGYILGFVINKSVELEGILVLWRLLPHGIFEIPAILISIGMGLRLGGFLFVSKDKSVREFWKWIKDSFRVFVFIVVPLLVVAAIIEGGLIWFLG
jgi:stage II sporulation protein M